MSSLNSAIVSLDDNPQQHNVITLELEKVATEVVTSNQTLYVKEDKEDEAYVGGPCVKCLESLENKISQFYDGTQTIVSRGFKVLVFLLYAAYFTYCMYYRFGDEGSIVLLVGTILLLLYLTKRFLASKGYSFRLPITVTTFLASKEGRKARTVLRYGLYLAATAGICFFLGFDVFKKNPHNSQSLLGIASLILVCFIISRKPSRINWHPVFWGFSIQFLFATLTLRTQFGYKTFKWIGDLAQTVVNFSDAGSKFALGEQFKTMGLAFTFLFATLTLRTQFGYKTFKWIGDLAQTVVNFSDAGSKFALGEQFKTMGLAFTTIGVIVFFNSIIFLLTHWGIMEVVIIKMGAFLGFCLQTRPVESVNSVANIFMGLAEVGLLIRPYLADLSKSELCAVMAGGFASISGSVLGIFILLGAPANHLLTAAIISAPAALALSKIVYPETERAPAILQSDLKLRSDAEKGRNALSVCADGALMAMKIVVHIMANLMAFVSLLNMINAILIWGGQRAGVDGLSFEKICSYVLYPLSYVMGVPPEDCGIVGSLIGTKLFATPMVGYSHLGTIIKNRHILQDYIANNNTNWHWSGSNIILESINQTLINGVISERAEVIATYAMCGFSDISAIGICIGSFTSMCPSKKRDIAQVVLMAFFVGNVANFVTGTIAGLMYT